MTAPTLTNLKFYIVTPAAAINYVTNPTPYKATTGYVAYLGSIALDDTYSRRGPGCIKVTPTTDVSGVYFDNISITNSKTYTFSTDVKGESGKGMSLFIRDAGSMYPRPLCFG